MARSPRPESRPSIINHRFRVVTQNVVVPRHPISLDRSLLGPNPMLHGPLQTIRLCHRRLRNRPPSLQRVGCEATRDFDRICYCIYWPTRFLRCDHHGWLQRARFHIPPGRVGSLRDIGLPQEYQLGLPAGAGGEKLRREGRGGLQERVLGLQ